MSVWQKSKIGEKEMEEDGRKAEILFLLDRSSFMKNQDKGHKIADAIRQMVYSLPSGYAAGLTVYSTNIMASVVPDTDMNPNSEIDMTDSQSVEVSRQRYVDAARQARESE